jgi:outer membrane protein TolC
MSILDLSAWIQLRVKEIFVVARSFDADGSWLQEGRPGRLVASLVATICLLQGVAAIAQDGASNSAPAGLPTGITTGGAAASGASLPVLKRSITSFDKSADYASVKEQQTKPSSIGREAVLRLGKEEFAVNEPEHPSDEKVEVEPPRLAALVSVSRNLNPFALDSDFQQRVTLRDVLLTASGANLNILESVSVLEARKWALAHAMTSYLPSINLGFNEIGLNTKLQLPLKSTAIVSGSATPVMAQASQLSLATPLTVLNSGFNWTPIQGGRLLSRVRSHRHQFHAAKAGLRSDISNTLLAATNSYWDLIYNGAVLQIRVAAVGTSAEQVKQNTNLASHGMATSLDVLQAKAQLAKDRQNLLDQQRLRRGAAIKLAHLLNSNLGQDLIPAETVLCKVRLIAPDTAVNQLLRIAVDNRPELKQYEELRLAARQQITSARADLLPRVSFGGNILGISSKTGTMNPTYFLNFGVNWQFEGLGTAAMTNMEAARWQARQSLLQANQMFLNVFDQVRNSHNETVTAERAIDEATDELLSAQEELRLARLRLERGLGTNLEVLTAQRDLTQARVDQALALVNFNKSQTQLLHDIGLISIDNVTSGHLVTTPGAR